MKDNENTRNDEGITPWGTRFVTYFYDKEGNPTTEDKAYEFHIQEYNSEGKMILETIAYGKDE